MSQITIERHGKVTLFTINRPGRKNAICKDTALELQAGFTEFDASEQRVAVITGAGEDAFSSGADVSNLPELWRCIPGAGFTTDKPIIAATAGWVVGGAMVLTMMCDLVVAAESTRFSYPEARLGFTGGMIAGLAARIPHKAAMDLMLLGRTMDARRAYDIGLVSDLVATGKHLEVAMEQAGTLAESAPLVLTTIKRFVNQHVLPKSPAESMSETMRQLNAVRESADTREGMAAFRDKRTPQYTGR
ncbi:enoyl-CoA hydratase/isomerase family protein [Variovorax sp.]|uniref:enoyl-CoA hydratase/isomerase family protein n=1 Tax=Variovorax sp. TaxID=1871043 RepID=UPI002D2EA767|nr:enoyl-CoA hydratase-related protein [Variovorax sp.]HYP85887.1 enoyl-CoA hydratase-related protein [Variovorax sp.]